MEINGVEAERIRMKYTQQKLDGLMPFDEWCRTVNPTEAAKEIYAFVRLTLERELEASRKLDERRIRSPRGPGRPAESGTHQHSQPLT